jgi:hypothetical protein
LTLSCRSVGVGATQELNGFELGGRKLTCQRANTQVPRSQQGVLNGVGFNPLMTGLLQANMLGGMVPGAPPLLSSPLDVICSSNLA